MSGKFGSMNNDYRPMEPPPAEAVARCPCCGSSARVWEYTDKPGAPVERVVMCDHEGGIGPRDALVYEGCLLQMPPQDFYRGTGREAVRYWNEYAQALVAERGAQGERMRECTWLDLAKTKAAEDVLRERERQMSVEGWSSAHDDEHDAGELAAAAATYGLAAADLQHPLSQGDGGFDQQPPLSWPWDRSWWKPGLPRRMLVKAGALVLAAIEQIDRAGSEGRT